MSDGSIERRARRLAVGAGTLLAALAVQVPQARAQDPCAAPINVIACENSKPGTPESAWQIGAAGDETIQGYATPISVNHGQRVDFKVDTDATDYTLEIYRLGWYGGDGARLVAVQRPDVTLPQAQPACIHGSGSTGLVDCGNWAVSGHWNVPASAVSGVYIARLVRADNGGDSHILFVVRDDERHARILYQTSDTTWQAYNTYGGASLYGSSILPGGARGSKVSYNRPIITRAYNANSPLFNGEYPFIRWLERNGYDISYSTGVDTASRGPALRDHSVFLTAGHDEYWSGEQRTNVEAARDAGVDMAFFTGNNVYWKTRWENSIDGAGTPFKTLVSYKDSTEGVKQDPTSTWTGTWRDPMGAAYDGGRPENALVGTIFTVNAPREDTLRVPYKYSRMRLWRGTSVASLQPGQQASLTPGMLGHEWNEDVDNGFRPPGLIDMSESTYDVENKTDSRAGASFAPGTATHKLTLYRAPSGALVFSAGTVQWAWGLDDHHDKSTPAPDARAQQATANLLADMGAPATTPQSGLTTPTASTDTVAPTATITAPAGGAAVHNGDDVTISGTATDGGGGVVAGIEVSTDGGTTWHPADFTAAASPMSWSYHWRPSGGFGNVVLRARAADDSANLQATPSSITVNSSCPCSLWGNSLIPFSNPATETSSIELGVKFQAQMSGYITGVRFYKAPGNTGTHVGSLWTATGTLLARATFTGETASGWQEATFDQPVQMPSNTTYLASYHAPNGGYSLDRPYFDLAYVKAPLRAVLDGPLTGNGVYRYGATPVFPDSTYASSNYWVDVAFTDALPPDVTPPRVTTVQPASGATGVDPRGDVSAEFSEAIAPATVTTSTFTLRTSGGTAVPAAVSYDAPTRSAVLRPTAPLTASATYTATVKGGAGGVKDIAGNALAADRVWSFTVAAPPTCPCSLFTAASTPDQPATNETAPVELGLRFRADSGGYVTAIRFYRAPGSTGSTVVSLWSAAGALLARVPVAASGASGWQQIGLPNPVAISGDTTYVASYFSPSGNFAVTRAFFTTPATRPPLRSATDGPGNGVYRYGSAPGFPDGSYQASNYWVDVVFNTTLNADTTAPTVVGVAPAAGTTGADARGPVTATFSEALDAATLTGSSFFLRDGAGATVAATLDFDALSRTATLRPQSPLAYGGAYTATLKGGLAGIKDTAGNPLAADTTWSFTVSPQPACPCSLFAPAAVPAVTASGEASPLELGVRFRSDLSGYVTAIRLYRAGSGTNTVNLWTDSGALLARTQLPAGAAPGWQQVQLPAPVAVQADTTYVASYFSPSGNFAVDRGYFETPVIRPPLRSATTGMGNGVYRYGAATGFPDSSSHMSNYWVDVVFDTALPPDTTPPVVQTVTPADGATGVDAGGTVSATFNEAIAAATLTTQSFRLTAPGGAAVAASVGYDPVTRTATLQPGAALLMSSTYTATVTTAVKDSAGNALAADRTWTFTTAGARACPCSLWTPLALPATPSVADPTPIEVGVRFQSDENGLITGLRFYKGLGNTGTHVASLWTSGGFLLARATFTGESVQGWQQVSFDAPVTVTADTVYVASYFAPSGGFAVDRFAFVAPFANAPLRVPGDAQGGNGVYGYAAAPAFPRDSYQASNFWVDVVFNRS